MTLGKGEASSPGTVSCTDDHGSATVLVFERGRRGTARELLGLSHARPRCSRR